MHKRSKENGVTTGLRAVLGDDAILGVAGRGRRESIRRDGGLVQPRVVGALARLLLFRFLFGADTFGLLVTLFL